MGQFQGLQRRQLTDVREPLSIHTSTPAELKGVQRRQLTDVCEPRGIHTRTEA